MKSVFRALGFSFVVYILLFALVRLLNKSQVQVIGCEDGFEIKVDSEDRVHERAWTFDSFRGSFCMTYESQDEVSRSAFKYRNSLSSNQSLYEKYWGDIYRKLVEVGKKPIKFLKDSLEEVAIEKRLSRVEQASLVVSFVQDIPYSYVISKACEEVEDEGHPCLGETFLGILSPYEFIHSLYGDCDTRSVLIYTLLEEMGFDPMIVISKEYAHAMLAVHLPAVGDYLTYQRKNYYFWETTGKNWPVGVLPPSSKNVDYWKVALVNEF